MILPFSLGWLFTGSRCDESYGKEDALLSESKIADVSGYVVFVAPLVWDSLIFQTYINGRSYSKAVDISKEIVNENIKGLKNIIKKQQTFKSDIKRFLRMYERGHIESCPKRNKLFTGMHEVIQEEEMQKKSIEPVIVFINKLSGQAEMIMRENIYKLIKAVEKEKDGSIWITYGNVIDKALRAMRENTSVKNSLDITIKEFNTKISQILLNKETNRIDFNMEKARFNLGGTIYSPGLLEQIAGKLDDSDKDVFVEKLVRALISPVLSLKAKVSGYTPENIKEETIKYIKSVTGVIEVYSLKKEIDEAQDMRSQSICRRTQRIADKKPISHKIDEVQMKNTQRMLRVLQEADPALFKDFITMDTNIAKKYVEYIRTGGGDKKLKQEIELFFNLR
ncbi:hypothetical protein NEMIN01_1836 [Nematocida minor]|uniref:uncharacterized protein n=1 Tax=Nematocida minor TaxID=1912983 RepID=UPI00221EAE7D|nr:uncharacterized protein NEMIN01_1836 [Nematocida minor]KAI5192143.1 hypothetical protein NEMIN01_1836 [Nematocida minor]